MVAKRLQPMWVFLLLMVSAAIVWRRAENIIGAENIQSGWQFPLPEEASGLVKLTRLSCATTSTARCSLAVLVAQVDYYNQYCWTFSGVETTPKPSPSQAFK